MNVMVDISRSDQEWLDFFSGEKISFVMVFNSKEDNDDNWFLISRLLSVKNIKRLVKIEIKIIKGNPRR